MTPELLRFVFCALVLLLLAAPSPAAAQIVVEILDAPPSVYSYEPIYVTFEVRNEGREPIVIPADVCPHEGAFLRVGKSGEELKKVFRWDCSPRRLVRLTPGQRWLFFRHAELGPEGDYEIEAVLRNQDECRGRLVGPGRDLVEPARVPESDLPLYDCWVGELASSVVEVSVQIPSSDVDLAASRLLELGPMNWRSKLILASRDLLLRYPMSHYTYAAAHAAGGGRLMVNVVILQPENPLNTWVVAAIVEDIAKQTRPCVHPPEKDLRPPPDLEERYARVIAAYPPPKPVADYLRQQQLEYAAETCDSEKPAGNADDSGPPPPGSR